MFTGCSQKLKTNKGQTTTTFTFDDRYQSSRLQNNLRTTNNAIITALLVSNQNKTYLQARVDIFEKRTEKLGTGIGRKNIKREKKMKNSNVKLFFQIFTITAT